MVSIAQKCNFYTVHGPDGVGRKDEFSFFAFTQVVVHVGTYLRGSQRSQQVLHGFFVVDHFPVAGKVKVIIQGIQYRDHGLPGGFHRKLGALKHVSCIYQIAVRHFFALGIQKSFQVRVPASLAIDRFPIFPKQLVMGMDLAMHISRL